MSVEQFLVTTSVGFSIGMAVLLFSNGDHFSAMSGASGASKALIYLSAAAAGALITQKFIVTPRNQASRSRDISTDSKKVQSPADLSDDEVVFSDPKNPFPFFATQAQVEQARSQGMVALTPEQLAKYDGSNDSLPRYTSVKGKIFDVSSSSMYKRALRSTSGAPADGGGGYGVLLGKDASFALATMSLKEEDLHHSLLGVTRKQLKVLNDWEKFYAKRYSQVGLLTKE